MSVLVLLQVEAAPGSEDEVAALFAEFLPDTRKFDGCESISLHRDHESPGRLVLVERWTARERHEAYSRWRAERGDAARMAALVTARDLRYFDDLDA